MSTVSNALARSETFVPPPYEEPHIRRQCDEMIQEVADRIAPVWPLKDYVAVNPYAGLTELPFLQARSLLKVFSTCETLMPISYFAQAYQDGQFSKSDIETAISELGESGHEGLESVTPDGVLAKLRDAEAYAAEDTESENAPRSGIIRSFAQQVDRYSEMNWSGVITDEISKHCSAHYDEGQATWQSPWRHLSLYQAWRSTASIDRNVETLGCTDFRKFVQQMPHTPDAAIVWLLQRAGVPTRLWTSFLLCQAYTIPGWSAWTKYHSAWTGNEWRKEDLTGLLAMRLAYDVAVAEAFSVTVNWDALLSHPSASFEAVSDEDSIARLVLLRATEIAYRDVLIKQCSRHPALQRSNRKLAQMVFCIDVRSERIRRNLESASDDVETFGFAGFFGIPMQYVGMGEKAGVSHLPVLLSPSLTVHETVRGADPQELQVALERRERISGWRAAWRSFASSATGCFPFVETTGLYSGIKLLVNSFAAWVWGKKKGQGHEGLTAEQQAKLGPTSFDATHECSGSCDHPTLAEQISLAENLLRNLGLTKNFARLVVFCGHASGTTNNPLAAGLDCGACGGHSGKPNAEVAAMLLNRSDIRAGLAEVGIVIDDDTHFVAAVHNTTTDDVQFSLDLEEIPATHYGDVEELQQVCYAASTTTRVERMPIVDSSSPQALIQRAFDWSEVRPEWGLAGNAAFIAAPRWMTRHVNLDGRSFLHSYEHESDPEGTVLETIMTAPMVVAHWINMQYYASTVDNRNFGSGNKTIHNVVGRFGILSGNSGDLMTGLPWQSLHSGTQLQHRPMRLQAVLAAPRSNIEAVIAKHELVADMLSNEWLHLVAFDDGQFYRYATDGSWQAMGSERSASPAAS